MPNNAYVCKNNLLPSTSIGDRLKQLRLTNNLSQSDLATKIGLNNKTLSGYENNVSMPNYEVLTKLAQFYNVSIDYLVNGKENLTHSTNENFKKRLRASRRITGMTQQELSDKLCISRSCIANYETGQSCPDLEMLNKISTILGVSVDFLLGKDLDDILCDTVDLTLGKKIKEPSKDEAKLNLDLFFSYAELLLKNSSDIEKDKIYKVFSDIYFKSKSLM